MAIILFTIVHNPLSGKFGIVVKTWVDYDFFSLAKMVWFSIWPQFTMYVKCIFKRLRKNTGCSTSG